MKWIQMRGVVAVALVTLSVGCAIPGRRPEPITAAVEPAISSVRSSDAETATLVERSQEATSSSFRLASAQFADTEPATRRPDDTKAGREFLPPPEAPAAPPEIELNQTLAPQGEPLTLEAIESLACQNNPTLLQAQGQIEGEVGKAIQAGLWPNPTLSYVQEQIGVKGTPGEFVGSAISQRIVTGHKLDLSRAKFLART